jgi:adenine-specific DNA-methyltransferase
VIVARAKTKVATKKNAKRAGVKAPPETYRHPEASSLLRPDVGTQAQFKKKKPPITYRYDSSLSPVLEWDGQNSARERGEELIARIMTAGINETKLGELENPEAHIEALEAEIEKTKAAGRELQALSRPFLNWAGKAERLSFEVPTLPLFVHERLSTKAIIETLVGHRNDRQLDMYGLFGDPQHSVADQVLRAYEFKDQWVNRMILGDSVVVMNSLLQYEGLGGQVQMIYMDPPYGVKFGSNFQPFVRRRDVKNNEDEDMTREPEMVKAYRDTWELGLHSYLTYLRDRLLLARDLLAPSGSIFVQISDENIHYVRAIMDEVFGASNFISQVSFQTTSGFNTSTIATLGDFLLWYAKDIETIRIEKLFQEQPTIPGEGNARWVLLPDGTYRGVTAAERRGDDPIPNGARFYTPDNMQSQGAANEPQPFTFEGKTYSPNSGAHWKANYPTGLERLAAAGRIHVAKNSLRYRRFATDFPYEQIGNIWTDTITGSFTEDKIYVVQTNTKVVERCVMLASRPGDLVLDPTCGSGTTAYVAEGLGRRWITIDTSRVPLALARQRLLTATFPYYELKEESLGPAGAFVYRRKQNQKGEEIGGIVPHITLESIANDEPPDEEVLVDHPEIDTKITRVSGPFCLEATIPTPVDFESDGKKDSDSAEYSSFLERMLEILRRAPVVRLGGGRTVTLRNIRPPAKSLTLSAEAEIPASASARTTLTEAVMEAAEKGGGLLPLSEKTAAIVFGPENGAVSEKLVYQAAREAYAKSIYSHLFVIGFAIQANARKLVDDCESVVGIPATYLQMTPDVMMGDLLKTMRSSQIFSICGLPEIKIHSANKDGSKTYQVEILGLDEFDPATMDSEHRRGDDLPAWFLDIDYNDLCFHVSQAFFPRTAAWDNLKRALKATYDESVWDHLAGTMSAPFEAGAHKQIAVKVIDDRGNELLVVKSLA